MGITVKINGDVVTVFYERPATEAEKAQDVEAVSMVEVVNLTFGETPVNVSVNRDLVAAD